MFEEVWDPNTRVLPWYSDFDRLKVPQTVIVAPETLDPQFQSSFSPAFEIALRLYKASIVYGNIYYQIQSTATNPRDFTLDFLYRPALSSDIRYNGR